MRPIRRGCGVHLSARRALLLLAVERPRSLVSFRRRFETIPIEKTERRTHINIYINTRTNNHDKYADENNVPPK